MPTPAVAIIIPCFNEQDTLEPVLEAICRQTFPVERMEVVIADGMSTDASRLVAERFGRNHPQLRLIIVDNPSRRIPAALNRAVAQTQADLVLRLDAHSIPAADYVERCREASEATGAANVGGVWDIESRGRGWLARAIAVAGGHPLGAGDARYRTGGAKGEVDTVPFGAFRREWLEKVGPFNEALKTNEDYEYNVRLRQAGGKIWFDPAIRSAYLARPDLGALACQYGRYGFWKARMALSYPGSLRWRQLLPPVFVVGVILTGLSAAFLPSGRWLLGGELGAYGLVVFLAGLSQAARRRDPGLILGFPAAVAVMHVCWGSGFLAGMLTGRAGSAVG